MIVTYDHNQDILTHHNQKRGLWAIRIPIYTSPSHVGEVKKYLLLKPNTIKFCTKTIYLSILLQLEFKLLT